MKAFKPYNSIKYINSILELKKMTLESTLPKYTKCVKYSLDNTVSDYMKYVDIEPFYIPPSFSNVTVNSKLSSLNPKFILFSAPGATGKSSLAKYLSYKFNAIYWDLSKIILGTNSFVGSILNAIGAANYSQFIDNLDNSKVVLVIDAIDEAEIISGRKMISEFINDINKNISNCTNPSVILLARTETAQYIASFCAENDISVKHYEIGFFPENKAKEFIEKKLNSKVITVADRDCINQYYNTIRSSLSDKDYDSFLGYAPVLEAISEHINSYPNRSKVISMLSGKRGDISLIIDIMNELLEREQTEKVTVAFKKRCEDMQVDFSDWDKLYSPIEQLVRITYYILFNDTSFESYNLDFLPSQLINEYQELLDNFLPQHPFIRQNAEIVDNSIIDFTGPAFRDYTLAKLISCDEFANMAELYFDELSNNRRLASQIFYDCYKVINNDTVNLVHLSYLFESYRAKTTAMQYPYLHCSKLDEYSDNPTTYGVAIFGMSSIKNSIKEVESDELTLLSTQNMDDVIAFDQLSHITLDCPDLNVKIGKSDEICRICNSTIICKKIEWGTKKITIESYSPSGCMIVCSEAITGVIPNIEIACSEDLRVDIPNINNYYRLRDYKYSFDDCSNSDIVKFTYALRNILIEFRTHKKDTMAKDAKRIDNVIVGNSAFKKQVLDFLISEGVIYRETYLYKIDIDKLRNVGINYQVIVALEYEQMKEAYQKFNTMYEQINT